MEEAMKWLPLIQTGVALCGFVTVGVLLSQQVKALREGTRAQKEVQQSMLQYLSMFRLNEVDKCLALREKRIVLESQEQFRGLEEEANDRLREATKEGVVMGMAQGVEYYSSTFAVPLAQLVVDLLAFVPPHLREGAIHGRMQGVPIEPQLLKSARLVPYRHLPYWIF